MGLTLWAPDGPPPPVRGDMARRRALSALLTGPGVSVLDVGVVVLRPSLDLEAVARLAGLAAALGGDRLTSCTCTDPAVPPPIWPVSGAT